MRRPLNLTVRGPSSRPGSFETHYPPWGYTDDLGAQRARPRESRRPTPSRSRPAGNGSRLAAHYLAAIGKEAFRRKYFVEDTSALDKVGYLDTPMVPNRFVWLKPTEVSLPADNFAGSARILDLLPTEVSAVYGNPAQLIRSDLSAPYVVPHKPFLGVRRQTYESLIRRLVDCGLVQLQKQRPTVVNGIFAVPKGEKQRLIIDARNANTLFSDPPDVDLPSPALLADLFADDGCVMYATKSDMDCFYYRLAMPAWLHQSFGSPQLRCDGVAW